MFEKFKNDNVMQDVRYILFLKFIMFSGILGMVFSIVHTINKRPISNFIIPLVISIVSLALYQRAQDQENYTGARISFFVFVTFIVVPLAYINSPGSQSAILHLMTLIMFMVTILSVKKLEYLFSVAIIIESLVFMRTELWFPDRYYKYIDAVYRINDISLNLTVVLVAILVTVYYMMKSYEMHYKTLYDMSIIDSLTGLYNRRYFYEFSELEYNRSQKNRKFFSIVFIDLNYFKRINDTFGHNVGDIVLKDIATIITENIRENDVAARYGGDEFIIIYPNTAKEEASKYINDLHEKFEEYSKRYSEVEFSVGIGYSASEGKTLDEIIAIADENLYEHKAKRKEKNKKI